MITIIASIIGFLSSLMPEIISLIRLYFQNKNSAEALDKKIQILQMGGGTEDIKRYDIAHQGDLNYDNLPTGGQSGGTDVRTILAYGFFAMYVVMKCIQFAYLHNHLFSHPVYGEALDIEKLQIIMMFLWTEQDQAFLPMIVSSYFGQRMMGLQAQNYLRDMYMKSARSKQSKNIKQLI